MVHGELGKPHVKRIEILSDGSQRSIDAIQIIRELRIPVVVTPVSEEDRGTDLFPQARIATAEGESEEEFVSGEAPIQNVWTRFLFERYKGDE